MLPSTFEKSRLANNLHHGNEDYYKTDDQDWAVDNHIGAASIFSHEIPIGNLHSIAKRMAATRASDCLIRNLALTGSTGNQGHGCYL